MGEKKKKKKKKFFMGSVMVLKVLWLWLLCAGGVGHLGCCESESLENKI